MMTSISGELGAGKTYHMVRELYKRYLQGYLIITNFDCYYSHICVKNDQPLLLELILQIINMKMRGIEISNFIPSFHHTGVFVALDEAHLVFGQDTGRSDLNDTILPFISLARKESVDIWHVEQDPALIHKIFRRYTNTWKFIRPVFPFFRKKLVPHPTTKIMRVEQRLLVPLVWVELHKLNYENPIRTYHTRMVEIGDGMRTKELTEQATLQKKSLSRNSDPFIHSLYDSNEMPGVNQKNFKDDFSLIKDVAFIPNTLRPSKFPTFKRWMHIKSGTEIPTRFKFRHFPLPEIKSLAAPTHLKQPVEILDDISYLLAKNPEFQRLSHLSRTDRKAAESKVRQAEQAKAAAASKKPFHYVKKNNPKKDFIKSQSKNDATKPRKPAVEQPLPKVTRERGSKILRKMQRLRKRPLHGHLDTV